MAAQRFLALVNGVRQMIAAVTSSTGASSGAVVGLNASLLVDTTLLPAMGASGVAHGAGLAPDPGSTAGTTRYLREDATWVAAPATSVSAGTGISLSGAGTSASPYSIADTAAATSQTANYVYAAPNGSNGTPSFRALVPADISAPINSSGAGYMIADGHLSNNGLSLSAFTEPVANRVFATQFVLTAPMIFGHCVITVNANVAASSFNVGIYNAATGTKLIDVSFSTAATGTVSVSFAQVTLPPGIYYFAWAGTSTSVTVYAVGVGQSTIVNVLSVTAGYSANALASGSLPSSLGSLTASTYAPPYAAFSY